MIVGVRRRLTRAGGWRQLRVDTTVVQTDISSSTDNTLLWDVVRVVTALGRPPRRSAGTPAYQRGSGIEHDRPGVGCWRSNG